MTRYAAATLLLLTACAATQQPGDVTVAELFKNPKKYNRQRVAIIGYYVAGLEESSLYTGPAGQNEYSLGHGTFTRSIWVDAGSDRLSDHYVRAVGVFHYRPKYRREILTRDDGRPFESITPLGYGHMGLSPAELVDVSSFRALR